MYAVHSNRLLKAINDALRYDKHKTDVLAMNECDMQNRGDKCGMPTRAMIRIHHQVTRAWKKQYWQFGSYHIIFGIMKLEAV